MSRSEYEIRILDQESGRIEDRRTTGRCPVHGCLLIIGRNGEVFKQAICPECEAAAPEPRHVIDHTTAIDVKGEIEFLKEMDAKEAAAPEPHCECVGCDSCQGEGTVRVETDRGPALEACSECGGGGTIRTCEYCRGGQ